MSRNDVATRSAPTATAPAEAAGPAPLLQVEELVVAYKARNRTRGGDQGQVIALDGVNLSIMPGHSLGVVGESGSGKSTLARAVVGLVRPQSGRIRYDGEDLLKASRSRLHQLRGQIQMVFQDPYGSVNPRSTVRGVIAEPLENYHRKWSRAQRDEHVMDLLARVRLPSYLAGRSVAGLSGGQLQRVGIARALALGPRLLVADEPVSALDLSIQARVLNLMVELKESEQISLLFITHNLAVAQFIADHVAVVYGGRVMEVGSADEVIESPQHPYTKELLAAIPGTRQKRTSAVDQASAPTVGQVGCPYRNRCPQAEEVCTTTTPPLEQSPSGRLVACHVVNREWTGVRIDITRAGTVTPAAVDDAASGSPA
jgi:oligopeptide/dipeptide ABC transporter ATP-binding protein